MESLETTEKKTPFITVDRRPEYLKESLVNYLKENDLENKLSEIAQFYDHGQSLVKQNLLPKKKNNKNNGRRRKSSSYDPLVRFRLNKERTSDIVLAWPLSRDKFWISSFFGRRKNRDGSSGFHYGIDMAALKGTPVKAAGSGTVIEATYAPGYGKTIVIAHNNKYKTRYAHLNSIEIKVGDKINRGQRIGTVGDTGNVRSSGEDASHLHFEVYLFNKQINPLLALA